MELKSMNEQIVMTKVRDKLINEMISHSDLYDECDLQRVKSDDWTIQRFMIHTKGDVDNAFSTARDAMLWRKTYGINTRTDLDFPMELYKIGAIFSYNEDREGRNVLYFRVKLYKTFPNLFELFRQFIIHLINKIDIQSGSKGFLMVWDITGVRPSNWDISMIRFIISSLRNYFTGGLKYLLVYGIPWIMNPFVAIAMKLIPEESRNKIKFISNNQLFDYIEQNNVPDFIGGKCLKCYRETPKGVIDLRIMAKERDYNPEEVENILKYYEKELSF